ncbi:MATE family efflux transporter [Clostridium sp. AM58-1XD]|nr:MATE family efflux transporter [Clostridium sp. AM58-1XD]
MTSGNPVKLILGFMIPVYLGNIFQQFYNLADAMIAGKFIGVDALAAIGSTTSLIFLVIGWLNGITSGFAILIAQCFGAGKYDRMRHYLAMSVYLCVGFVILMTAGLLVFNVPILRMMNAPEDLIGDIAGYLAIIYAGLFVTAAYNGLAAVLRALGDSRSPLYFLIISAIINVFLDIAFIVYFHMGVEGCGYATVISQGISALLCLIYMIKKFSILKLQKRDWEFSVSSASKMLGLGVPMGLQFSITAIGTIIVQGAVNVYGAVYMAGFSAAGKIQNIISTIYVAFGATIATYVGQNRGAGRMDRVHQGVKVTQTMILITSIFVMAAVHFGGPFLTTLFIDPGETEAIQSSLTYFHTVVLFYPFLGSIFLYRNALQGLGYGLVPMMGGVFELVARAAVIMAIAGRLGFMGVCLSDPMAWLAALIPIVPYYFMKMRKIKLTERTEAAYD